MNSIKFKKESWHVFLVEMFTPWTINGSRPINICQYMRWVAFGAIWGTIVAVVATIIASLLISVIVGGSIFDVLWLLGKVHFHEKSQSFLETCGLVFTTMLFLTVGIITILGLLKLPRIISRWWYNIKPEPKPSGFIHTAYRSWKDKVCFQVKFEGKDYDDSY